MTCKNCGKELPAQNTGRRPREYCDGACRIAHFRKRHAFDPGIQELNEAKEVIAELETKVQQLEYLLSTERHKCQWLEQQITEIQASRSRQQRRKFHPLPDDLVGLYEFINRHGVLYQEVQKLIKIGFIHTIKGDFDTPKGRIEEALGAKGQREFWVQCHVMKGFIACDACPHE